MVRTECGHFYCKDCICRHIDSIPLSRPAACPMCRVTVTKLLVTKPEYCDEISAKYNGGVVA
jgi:hypothetical protein